MIIEKYLAKNFVGSAIEKEPSSQYSPYSSVCNSANVSSSYTRSATFSFRKSVIFLYSSLSLVLYTIYYREISAYIAIQITVPNYTPNLSCKIFLNMHKNGEWIHPY